MILIGGGAGSDEQEEEDLLRVFAPCGAVRAGPDLDVCRLAGSIVTLRREGATRGQS